MNKIIQSYFIPSIAIPTLPLVKPDHCPSLKDGSFLGL